MTHEKFTGATFNDLDPFWTRILRSSEFSVVNSTEIALNIPHQNIKERRKDLFVCTICWPTEIRYL